MVTFSIDADGVALITLEAEASSVNVLGDAFAAELEAALSAIEANENAQAVVITSGKRDFIVGADINVLADVVSHAHGERISRTAQAAMQRLEDFRLPVVAAISGLCLGGGLELALACDARIASADKRTKLGLPEVQLGLLPGAGGTQRLPRLIGIQAALDMMLTGKQVNAKKARRIGLLDDVVPAPLLVRVAKELACTLAEAADTEPKPLERLGNALGSLLSTDELAEIVLEDNPIGRAVLFDQAKKKLLKKTLGNYPAPVEILEAVKVGANKGWEAGLEAEARGFGKLIVTTEARELMRLFFATTEMKKDTGVDSEAAAKPVEKVGMIGAGLMGAGIAYVTSAIAKTAVRLKDRDTESVGKGLAHVRGILSGRVKRKRMSKRELGERMALVSGTTSYSGFSNAEVVIEAVFEDLELKRTILADVEAAGSAEVIFASNTSTIPITQIAEASAHPETVIGMHYFSPVHKMPLLEVIVTDKTADWVTATCVALGKAQGKTVIVVRDGVGFYTSRILGPYMSEAFHILAEGVPVDVIDRALVEFGFPVGPIKLLDEVGIDVAIKASGVVKAAFGDRVDAPTGMDKLVADNRLGKKNSRGFYLYGEAKKKSKRSSKNSGVDESIYELLGVSRRSEKMSGKDIASRCTLQMVNEAAHCLGEGILRSPRDGDIGAIFGLGFPPFRGGPFRYADEVGAVTIVGQLQKLERAYGPRFAPAPALIELADRGGSFYGIERPSVQT